MAKLLALSLVTQRYLPPLDTLVFKLARKAKMQTRTQDVVESDV
jgi:hypothetical protein